MKHIHNLIAKIDGKVGISMSQLENNWQIEINATEQFPMASTCKIAIVAFCLHLAEQKKLLLDKLISISPTDVRTGSGVISQRLTAPGISLSIKNLIRLMIEVSDNTATDLLLDEVGGPSAVTEFLIKNNINGMRLDRSFQQTIAEQMGIAHLLKSTACTPEQFIQLENSIDREEQEKSKSRFLLDKKDTTTPLAMRQLLEKILRHEILSPSSSQFLVECMGQCRTGLNRIRAGIPQPLWVGQKTGTMTGVTNDTAIVKLPEKNTTLVMAIYIKQSKLPLPEQENLIAEIARHAFESI